MVIPTYIWPWQDEETELDIEIKIWKFVLISKSSHQKHWCGIHFTDNTKVNLLELQTHQISVRNMSSLFFYNYRFVSSVFIHDLSVQCAQRSQSIFYCGTFVSYVKVARLRDRIREECTNYVLHKTRNQINDTFLFQNRVKVKVVGEVSEKWN